MRVVFMGTPAFAAPSLEALANSDHEVVGVVTQPDRPKGRGQAVVSCPVKELALAKGLPVRQPDKIKSPEFLQQLSEWKPDVIAVTAFGRIPAQNNTGSPAHGVRQRAWIPVTRVPGRRPDPVGAHPWGHGNRHHHDGDG